MFHKVGRLRLKCDSTRKETRFLLSAKRTSPFNLQAPCILYIGQAYRYSPAYAFHIFSQQIYLFFFRLFLPSSFIPPQNVVYFLMLPFLVHKIFTFYINGALNCKFQLPLGTVHYIYIYRTDVPLLYRVRFLYIQSTNIFNYFFWTFFRHLRLFLHKMSCIS